MDAIRRAHGGLKDDTSIIVLDLLPPGRTWPSIAGRKTASRQAAACLCFSPCAPAAEWQKLGRNPKTPSRQTLATQLATVRVPVEIYSHV